MDGQVSDPRLFPENLLGAVPVMNVPIDDEDPVEFELLDRHPGSHSNVVEQAKPHSAPGQRVVARRPDNAQSATVLAAKQPLRGVAHRTHRLKRDIVGAGTDNGVAVDLPPSRFGQRPDFIDVTRRVNLEESWPRYLLPFGALALTVKPRLRQPVEDLPDALGRSG